MTAIEPHIIIDFAKFLESPRYWPDEVQHWTDHTRAFAATHPDARPGLIRALVDVGIWGLDRQAGALAIKHPNIEREYLLQKLKQGRADMERVHSWRSLEGVWWLFTQGIQNPRLREWAKESEETLHNLDEICGCDCYDYLYEGEK